MVDKSHVSMEQKVCLVCGLTFDTGAILLDRRLRQSLDRATVTGFDLCPEHRAKYDEGYIALVEVDPTRSGPRSDVLKPQEAYRTGRVAHMKEGAFKQIFNVPSTDERGLMRAIVFIDPQALEQILKDAGIDP